MSAATLHLGPAAAVLRTLPRVPLRLEVRRMRWAGCMTYPEISAATGVCLATVIYWCRDLPRTVDPRSHVCAARRRRAHRRDVAERRSAVWVEKAHRLRSIGLTVKDVADMIGRHPNTVSRALRERARAVA